MTESRSVVAGGNGEVLGGITKETGEGDGYIILVAVMVSKCKHMLKLIKLNTFNMCNLHADF